MRRTIIVAGGIAAAARRLQAARAGDHGLEVRTIEQVAQRLAGGFLRLVDGDSLARAAEKAIHGVADLGDLRAIGDLPGLPAALAASLDKVWRAGIDLAAAAAAHHGTPRLAVMARLEAAVLEHLPAGALRHIDLAGSALGRLRHAPAVLGLVELDRLIDVAPCWRPLLAALGDLAWRGHTAPSWWVGRHTPAPAMTPARRAVTCATARHEVIEAMRWARGLLADGQAQAQDIAISAASPGEYDDLVHALAAEASLDVHFAHGRRALATRDGQAAAALADLLMHGLSQDRVRRLARLAHAVGTPFGDLPEGCLQALPRAAPLLSPVRWRAAITAINAADRDQLLHAVDLLSEGCAKATEAGELFLRGTARLLWRRALLRAPATALEASLAALRLPDTLEPATSIGWMHAATLGCCPRPHVWLLGLNARSWPRSTAEDPLLPDHVLAADQLEPLPVTRADRLSFHAIVAGTRTTLVCSASRRDATGRLLGLSPLMPAQPAPERLARARIPAHAMSEQDRMMARPAEFAVTGIAGSADGCWHDWNNPGVTAHDGAVRPGHPAIARALGRVHSATSLRALLRNPIGFIWRYALGWRQPEARDEPMELDALQFGSLVHAMLDAALPAIERGGGLIGAAPAVVAAALAHARRSVAGEWEAGAGVPPAILWALTLDRAEAMALAALSWPLPALPGARSYAEVAFGGMPAINAGAPWDTDATVTIPGTALRIQGRIDRLDLSGDGLSARLVDYKTGRPADPGMLRGGSELQRCLYGYVVQALLGPQVSVEAALLFPKDGGAYHKLEDTDAALRTLTTALLHAEESLRDGHALFGPDTGGNYDDMAFALPATPGALTERKRAAAATLLGNAALVWEQA